MCDLQTERPDINDVLTFWSRSCTHMKYPALFELSIRLLTMFGSTYICKSLFSNLNYIKNKHRNRLNQEHLEDLLMWLLHQCKLTLMIFCKIKESFKLHTDFIILVIIPSKIVIDFYVLFSTN